MTNLTVKQEFLLLKTLKTLLKKSKKVCVTHCRPHQVSRIF